MAAIRGAELNATKEYNGESDVNIYIDHIERNRVQFAWTPEQTANKLQGKAAAWLRTTVWEQKPTVTWLELRALLITRFRTDFNELVASDALRNIAQKDKEGIYEYYDRVCDAVDKKNHVYTVAEKLDPAYLQAFQRDVYTFFSAGMKDEIRMQAMAGADPPRTAETLLQAAVSVEIQSRKTKPFQVTSVTPEDNPPGSASKEEDKKVASVEGDRMKSLEEKIEALTTQFKGRGQGRGNRRGQGGRSSNRGGRQWQNRGYQGQNNGGYQGQNNGGQGQNGASSKPASLVTCYTCKGSGHYSFECPSNSSNVRGKYRGRGGSFPVRGTMQQSLQYSQEVAQPPPQQDQGWYSNALN